MLWLAAAVALPGVGPAPFFAAVLAASAVAALLFFALRRRELSRRSGRS
jgi:hypothetical protein